MPTPAGKTTTSAPAGLLPFMAAIRWVETGSPAGDYTIGPNSSGASGAYQILDTNWDSWAQEAGQGAYANLGSARYAPKAVQDAVARFKFLQYYRDYGSWYSVAQAWNGGPGCVNGNCSGGGHSGGVNGYAADVIYRMTHLPKGYSAGPFGSLGVPFFQVALSPGDYAQAARNFVAGVVTVDCYARFPSIDIGIATIGGWCLDQPIFGLLVLAGGAAMIVGAALIAHNVGVRTPAVQGTVNVARKVTRL